MRTTRKRAAGWRGFSYDPVGRSSKPGEAFGAIGLLASPHFSAMLEKRRHTVSSLRGKPFPAALNGPLPCRPPPDPLQRCLLLPSGPEQNLNVSSERGLHGSSLGSEARKPGRYGSRRTEKLRCQRGGTPQDNHRDLALEYSGYAYLLGSKVKEISGGLV